MTEYNYDLVVIGAGPGGYEVAFEAVKYGMKVAVIEKDKVGGTCLNRGCVPTKTIMRSSELANEAREGARIGIRASAVEVDLDAVRARKDEVLDVLREGIESGLAKAKIDLIHGLALVRDEHTVSYTDAKTGESKEVSSKFILIATGGSPFIPPISGAELEGVMDSTELLEQGGTPFDDFVIIGGGVIGVEFANVYHGFGSHVTIVEAMDRLIPTVDKELARSLKMSLQKDGVEVLTKCPVVRIEQAKGRLAVVYTDKDEEKSVPADAVLMAVGRRSDVPGLLSDELQHLAGEHGRLAVDEHYRSASPSIYGIGDAIGGIELAHTATAEGRNAVAHMNGAEPPIRMDTVPTCIYSMPEIASVGISADEAKSQGLAVITKKYAMGANGKTVIEDLGRGYIKLIADADSHILLGAQLMCGRATDLVGELALAISNKLTLEDISSTIHPHPTFVEAIAEAAR